MSDIKNLNVFRSEFLRNQHFDLDQIDLLARKLNESVEGVQMMIDGVADIPDEFARLIEHALQKPIGYLDFDGIEDNLKSKGNDSNVPTTFNHDKLTAQQSNLLENFNQLSSSKQELISELIQALLQGKQ